MYWGSGVFWGLLAAGSDRGRCHRPLSMFVPAYSWDSLCCRLHSTAEQLDRCTLYARVMVVGDHQSDAHCLS